MVILLDHFGRTQIRRHSGELDTIQQQIATAVPVSETKPPDGEPSKEGEGIDR